MPDTEPLDAAAVMGSAAAVLRKFPGARVGELNLFADLYDLAVRQAADLAEANRKLAAVEAVHIDELIEYEKQRFREGLTDDEDAVGALMQVRDHLRAALGGAQ